MGLLVSSIQYQVNNFLGNNNYWCTYNYYVVDVVQYQVEVREQEL